MGVTGRQRGERAEGPVGDVAKVEGGIHDFVVPKERNDLPSGRRCFVTQSIKKVENCAVIITTIDLVAGLNNHKFSARPMILFIDRPREPERAPRGPQVAVEVPECNKPRR